MAFFNWDDLGSVNIERIDNQHKKLVSYLNELFEAMRAGKGNEVLEKILNALLSYTNTHFASEEKLTQTHGYPGYLFHK